MFREGESGPGPVGGFSNEYGGLGTPGPEAEPPEAAAPTDTELTRLHAEAIARHPHESSRASLQRSAQAARERGEHSLAGMRDEKIADASRRADRAGEAAVRSFDAEQDFIKRQAGGEVSEAEAAARARHRRTLENGGVIHRRAETGQVAEVTPIRPENEMSESQEEAA